MEYIHGGDIYRNKVMYDFSVNVNPLGMPPRCIEEAKRGVELSTRYPDWKGEKLRRAIAAAEGVSEEQVLLGNGAAELIYALLFSLRPGKALIPIPSFGEYEAAVTAAGGECTFWRLREEEDFRLGEDFPDGISGSTDMVILCNPNNPTGAAIEKERLLRIAEKCEAAGAWLCVDECFLPFTERERELTMKHCLERFPRLIVLRAFTKIYGMPGLRLGYALASEGTLAGIRRCMQPWSTSIPAQMAGLQALKSGGFLEDTVKLVREERMFLRGELTGMPPGLVEKVYPSEANFLLLRGREDLCRRMLERGFLIRDCGNFRGLERESGRGYFRIAVRTHPENRALAESLRGCWLCALPGKAERRPGFGRTEE
ncbi:MAG: aminotransferase class I/II-fold pyridoxal phosphate-dependent enzyme [Roseburia sp.]|nr:aminotransferase class I/II-fold pyridoxal phosphate-dependent enzyme [Roseburia sp.]MCM1097841.1 aminotransferase class I/II-fold pyridoxal phosphate-dependent enzyme [Ruminococcus flavefaciens]